MGGQIDRLGAKTPCKNSKTQRLKDSKYQGLSVVQSFLANASRIKLCIFSRLRQGQLSDFGTGFSHNFGRAIPFASTGQFVVGQIACEITFAPNDSMIHR
nr:MAG: hypothetical protein EDM05_17845 [Leptolyngbya sp. IPPAS B-1204]